MIRRLVGMLLGAALLLLAGTCSAADMEFVDAQGYTGYYVDASSVTYESTAVCNATIAVIKADRNRMFRYTMRFNRGVGQYRILSSEVLAYDTKTVLSQSGAEVYSHPYAGSSPMKTIVDFIYNDLPHGDLPAPAPAAPVVPSDES